MTTTTRRLLPALLAATMLLAACGSGDTAEDAAEESAATEAPDDEAPVDDASSDDADETPAEARSATLVLDWTPNTNHGGLYAAQAEGYYDEVGIDLEIIQPGEGGAVQAVATGNAEFAMSYQEGLTPARATGVPVVSIAAVIEHNTSSLLALADSGIERPADLVGHTYGGFGGQLETALVNRLVECDGGDPSGVDFVEVGQTDYRVGLEQDDYDFVWIFDGWDKLRLEQEGVEVTTISFLDHLDCIPDWYTPLIATSESLIADDPDLVADFLSATSRGYQLAIDDPSTAADHLLAAAPELDEELVRASADYLAGEFAADPAAWGHQEEAIWVDFTEFLVDAGLVEEAIDVDAAYTNDFLPATTG